MQTKAACKPWLHTNHGWPTLIPYDVIFFFDGKKNGRKHPDLVVLCENRWKMGNYLLGQSTEWYKINAIVQVLSTRKFWYPTRPPWMLHAILARGDRFPCGLALYGAVHWATYGNINLTCISSMSVWSDCSSEETESSWRRPEIREKTAEKLFRERANKTWNCPFSTSSERVLYSTFEARFFNCSRPLSV